MQNNIFKTYNLRILLQKYYTNNEIYTIHIINRY